MKRTTPALFALVFAGACLQPAFAAEPVVTIDCATSCACRAWSMSAP
jgi:hypothetical protein